MAVNGGEYTDEIGRFKGHGNLILKKDRSLNAGIGQVAKTETSPRQRADMKICMPPSSDAKAM